MCRWVQVSFQQVPPSTVSHRIGVLCLSTSAPWKGTKRLRTRTGCPPWSFVHAYRHPVPMRKIQTACENASFIRYFYTKRQSKRSLTTVKKITERKRSPKKSGGAYGAPKTKTKHLMLYNSRRRRENIFGLFRAEGAKKFGRGGHNVSKAG